MRGIHAYYPRVDRYGLTWNNDKKMMNPTNNVDDINFINLQDYELIILYLSILSWKKYNGTIELYTNSRGLEMFERLKIAPMWDSIDTSILDNDNYNIDNQIFWASSKIKVINKLDPPFVILDLDLYVEMNLEEVGFFSKKLGVFHYEDFSLSYPDAYSLPTPNGFSFPSTWDWTAYPTNVAITYYGDMDFKKKYTEMSLNYMHNNNGNYIMDKNNSRMIFAEQRILGEMIKQYDIDTVNIIDGLFEPMGESDLSIGFVDIMNLKTSKFIEVENHPLHDRTNIKYIEHYINHLWGYKAVLMDDKNIRQKFVKRLLSKIEKDYNKYYSNVIETLEIFYKINIDKKI
jgi:hypothetical protein